jgi:hypothetical protein
MKGPDVKTVILDREGDSVRNYHYGSYNLW